VTVLKEHPASLGSRPESGGGLRVLIVQPTGDKMGHYGIFTVRLSQALGKLGHAVTICTNRLSPELYLNERPLFAIETVAAGRLAFGPFDEAMSRHPLYSYWGYYRNSYRITAAALTLCRRREFDVIYMTDVEFLVAALLLKTAATLPRASLAGLPRASLAGLRRARPGRLPPVVMEVSAANFSFADYPGSIVKKSYKIVQREVFRTTLGREIAACAVLSEWHQERLRAQLRVPDGFPVEVIPEGGDTAEAPPPRPDARRRLGIDFAGPVFLYFGIIRRDKGIETLLEAAARLRGDEFRIIVAGFPMEYSGAEVIELVRRAGLAEKVILRLGYVEASDVPVYFGAADALVLPYARSYRGGSGPLTKGACAYGRPVIATDVSGMGRVVERQAIGVVCPPESPEALATSMREFLSMPQASAQQMGERALALGRANSWDAMAQRFSNLFSRLVRSGRV
jgi:glycosyltransferase involved in cell wall biosynthesis